MYGVAVNDSEDKMTQKSKIPKTPKEPNRKSKKSVEIVEPEIIQESIIEPEITPEKQPGKVKQIEAMIVQILKENPEGMTSKDIIGKCPSEFNIATWQTRIYRLRGQELYPTIKGQNSSKFKDHFLFLIHFIFFS